MFKKRDCHLNIQLSWKPVCTGPPPLRLQGGQDSGSSSPLCPPALPLLLSLPAWALQPLSSRTLCWCLQMPDKLCPDRGQRPETTLRTGKLAVPRGPQSAHLSRGLGHMPSILVQVRALRGGGCCVPSVCLEQVRKPSGHLGCQTNHRTAIDITHPK